MASSFTINLADLNKILTQIKIAEQNEIFKVKDDMKVNALVGRWDCDCHAL